MIIRSFQPKSNNPHEEPNSSITSDNNLFYNDEQSNADNKLPPLKQEQIDAIHFIIDNYKREKPINSLCALDVGLGKTRVACEILNDFYEKVTSYMLVVCPTKETRDTIWIDTINAFNMHTRILVKANFRQVKCDDDKTLTIPPKCVCLITYANLCRGDNIQYFINNPPSMIVFDEFHTLTNNCNKKKHTYRNAVLKLPTMMRLGLTATPFVNNEMECVMAYGILNSPKMVKMYYDNKKKNSALDFERDMRKNVLFDYARQSNFFIYRENPYVPKETSEWFISIPMEKEMYAHYDYLCADNSDIFYRHNEVARWSLSPSLVKDRRAVEYITNKTIETGKVKAIKAILRHIPQDDKVIVFDNLCETLEYLQQQDYMSGFKPVIVHGQKSDKENKANLEHFLAENSSCRLLLTTRSKCGEGVNLQIANHVIILNCWYTAKDIIQMIGRIKRQGQLKPIDVFILGDNIFSAIGGNATKPEDFVLPEDLDFYQFIYKKIDINKTFNIELETKMPLPRFFMNPDTFESEFNLFLNKEISLPSVETQISQQIKAYNDEYYKIAQIMQGKSYLYAMVQMLLMKQKL